MLIRAPWAGIGPALQLQHTPLGTHWPFAKELPRNHPLRVPNTQRGLLHSVPHISHAFVCLIGEIFDCVAARLVSLNLHLGSPNGLTASVCVYLALKLIHSQNVLLTGYGHPN